MDSSSLSITEKLKLQSELRKNKKDLESASLMDKLKLQKRRRELFALLKGGQQKEEPEAPSDFDAYSFPQGFESLTPVDFRKELESANDAGMDLEEIKKATLAYLTANKALVA